MANCCTPTKRSYGEMETSPLLSSPKFMKPSDLFRKRARKNSPTKLTVSRGQLPLETVARLYSPLKCLQSTVCPNSPETAKVKSITFSPLMKKLQRSPARSSISFPIVKRLNNSKNSEPCQNANNKFNRVLNFSEDANLPDKSVTTGKDRCKSDSFHSINSLNIDWSIKSKLRVYTNRLIPFHGSFKVIDEATGLNHFVRGFTNTEQTNPIESENFSAELQRHCLVWQHPSLPWIKLFPRTPDLKPGSQLKSTAPIFSISPNSTLADSLHSEFCSSLHSLFKLLKSKYCPYFYMLANNFIVLFRASGVAGSNDAHALISPTTPGLRKLLDDEEIVYSMPFHSKCTKQSSSSSLTETATNSSGIGTSDSSELGGDNGFDEDIDEEMENVNADMEDQDQWLESLGLSQQDFPSLETSSLRRRRMRNVLNKSKKTIDDQTAHGKMKSIVRVDGLSNCQMLISLFINNRKICISNSGSLSGIPPTLLSPVAFTGATLTPITIKQKTTEQRSTNIISLDLSGPILPHTLYGIMSLFSRFSSTHIAPTETNPNHLTVVRSSLRTYDPSSSFVLENGFEANNTLNLNLNPTFAVENLLECGLEKKFLTAICTKGRQLATPLCDFELTKNGIRYNRSLVGINQKH